MKGLTTSKKLLGWGKGLLPQFRSEPDALRQTAKEDHTAPRLLAIGDIHGCLDQLQCLISRVEARKKDQFVFLGDYIDRGPDSRGVIEFLLQFKRDYPSTVFLKGNHEAMLLDYLQGNKVHMYMANGGWETLKNYAAGTGVKIPPEHLSFIENLQLYHEQESFIFVHAGLRPGIRLEDQDERDFLWIRHEFLDSNYEFEKTVVFGHTPLSEPLLEKRKIGLDTGAVYGRYLSCCDVRRHRFWDSIGWEKEKSP